MNFLFTFKQAIHTLFDKADGFLRALAVQALQPELMHFLFRKKTLALDICKSVVIGKHKIDVHDGLGRFIDKLLNLRPFRKLCLLHVAAQRFLSLGDARLVVRRKIHLPEFLQFLCYSLCSIVSHNFIV